MSYAQKSLLLFNHKNLDFQPMGILKNYIDNLKVQLDLLSLDVIELWSNDFLKLCKSKKQLFICGNGGSAGNAMHIANDFHYGVGCNIKVGKPGIRFVALPSNPSILTCLANDIG